MMMAGLRPLVLPRRAGTRTEPVTSEKHPLKGSEAYRPPEAEEVMMLASGSDASASGLSMCVEDFEEYYTKHWTFVYKLIRPKVNSNEDAEDITQDVFTKVASYY